MSSKHLLIAVFSFIGLGTALAVSFHYAGRKSGAKAAGGDTGAVADPADDAMEEIATSDGSINNPGNIIATSAVTYEGEIESPSTHFKSFKTLAYGYRAMIHTLQAYYTQLGKKNLTQILNTYAPPSDGNDTAGYINFISEKTGVDAITDIHDVLFSAKIKDIVKYMSQMEQGAQFALDDAAINSSYNLV